MPMCQFETRICIQLSAGENPKMTTFVENFKFGFLMILLLLNLEIVCKAAKCSKKGCSYAGNSGSSSSSEEGNSINIFLRINIFLKV